MKQCRTFGFIVIIAFLLGMGTGSGRAENGHESAEALQRIQTAGELRVGVSLFTPWTMTNTQGELVGFEIDVAKQMAKDIGVKPIFTVLDWKELLPALLQQRIDIIIAGMVITPERALKVNFSIPYASSGIGLATNLQLTKDFTGIKDLNRPSVKVTCVAETVSAELAQRLLPKATFQIVKTSQEAIHALTSGEVHAYIASDPLPTYLALEHPEKVDTPLSKPLIATRAAFAVNKGQADFVNFLNAWITAKEADTWLTSAQAYWFESLEWRPEVVKK
jgi:polar amino acid transport system substrate-binding protein